MQLQVQTDIYPSSPVWLRLITPREYENAVIVQHGFVMSPLSPSIQSRGWCRHIQKRFERSPLISVPGWPSTQQWCGARWSQLNTCIGIRLHTKLSGSTPEDQSEDWNWAVIKQSNEWLKCFHENHLLSVWTHTMTTEERSPPAHHIFTDMVRVRKTTKRTSTEQTTPKQYFGAEKIPLVSLYRFETQYNALFVWLCQVQKLNSALRELSLSSQ